jgi:Vanillate O-demethylase oxygenase C-terminal domain
VRRAVLQRRRRRTAVSRPAREVQREPTTYTLHLPLAVTLDQRLAGRHHFVLFLAVAPLGARRYRSFIWNARTDKLEPEADAALTAFQALILDQDRPIAESQRPEELPIDLSAELHRRPGSGLDRVPAAAGGAGGPAPVDKTWPVGDSESASQSTSSSFAPVESIAPSLTANRQESPPGRARRDVHPFRRQTRRTERSPPGKLLQGRMPGRRSVASSEGTPLSRERAG